MKKVGFNKSAFGVAARRVACQLLTAALPATLMATGAVHAATGEMGMGVPEFGIYAEGKIIVWGLANPTIGFPAGCTNIMLVRATLGAEMYKIGVATLTAAQLANRPVRFYSHSEHDGGCGVDYIQLKP